MKNTKPKTERAREPSVDPTAAAAALAAIESAKNELTTMRSAVEAAQVGLIAARRRFAKVGITIAVALAIELGVLGFELWRLHGLNF